jgi:hypothetical protein
VHANLRALTPLKARAEIELGFSAVQQAMGKPLAPFFRFPFLSDPKSMIFHLQERQVGIFSIDVDSKDYRTRDPGTTHRKVMADLARTKNGIVIFHDIQSSTARALPGMLAELKASGSHRAPAAEGPGNDRGRVRQPGPAGVGQATRPRPPNLWPSAHHLACRRRADRPVVAKASSTARPVGRARAPVIAPARNRLGRELLVSRTANP